MGNPPRKLGHALSLRRCLPFGLHRQYRHITFKHICWSGAILWPMWISKPCWDGVHVLERLQWAAGCRLLCLSCYPYLSQMGWGLPSYTFFRINFPSDWSAGLVYQPHRTFSLQQHTTTEKINCTKSCKFRIWHQVCNYWCFQTFTVMERK